MQDTFASSSKHLQGAQEDGQHPTPPLWEAQQPIPKLKQARRPRASCKHPKNQKQPLCGHKNHQLLQDTFGASEATPEVAVKDGQHLWSSLLEMHQPCPSVALHEQARCCLQTTVSTEVTDWVSKTTDSRKKHVHPLANACKMLGKTGSIQHLHFGWRSSPSPS